MSDGYYRPAWYPNKDPHHNPWLSPDPISGKTHYQLWCDTLKPGELLALIEEHHARARATP